MEIYLHPRVNWFFSSVSPISTLDQILSKVSWAPAAVKELSETVRSIFIATFFVKLRPKTPFFGPPKKRFVGPKLADYRVLPFLGGHTTKCYQLCANRKIQKKVHMAGPQPTWKAAVRKSKIDKETGKKVGDKGKKKSRTKTINLRIWAKGGSNALFSTQQICKQC